MDAQRAPLVLGGRFELENRAGEGGAGAVYRALDRQTGAVVAVKLLVDPLGGAERFGAEARLLSTLSHPGIVRYVDHGSTPDGDLYLAMEWLDGETLEDRLAGGPLSFAETATLAARALDALAVAHRRLVVHRDLKPSNLFLVGGDPAEVKVLDFGIARRLWDRTRATSAGASVGTPMYMSPEQARGEDVDPRSDLFSLGAVLFECLTGQPLFLGETEVAVLAKICLDDSVDVSARCPHLPLELADLLGRMLAKDREDRPSDTGLLALEMSSIADTLRLPRDTTRGRFRAPLRTPTPPITGGEHRTFSAVLVSRPSTDPASNGSDGPRIEAVRAALAGFGARLDRLRDGSMVVTLVGRGAPVDQAVAAARCALLVKGLMPECALAIATGRTDVRVRLPIGGVLESAARMLAGESAGRVRLDDATARLLETRFEIDSDGERRRYLVFEKGLREPPRTLLGREVPCFGRDRELGALVGLYDECVSEPVARAALVTAPAGGGKSRVRHELLARIQDRGERFELYAASGDSIRAGARFALLGPALRAAANVMAADPLSVQRERLAAHVGRRIEPEHRKRVIAFVGEIAGVPFPDEDLPQLSAARHDPRLMADQMLAAWLDFLEAEVDAAPVVFVLEDLHWGDQPSVDFLDAALRALREKPLLVLGFARPEIDELFPSLWVERDVQRLSLAPLTARAATRFVRHVLPEAPDARVAAIVERSEGNPFYLEEILRALGSGESAGPEQLPESVVGMVQARLDAIGDEAKRVLRAASIYGQSFRRAGVATLLGRDAARSLEDWLQILVEKEVLYPARGDQELAFRHALMRDAAYALLTEEDRRNGHRLAGEWLEANGERDAIVLVEHYERGGLPQKAALHCRTAAAQALEAKDIAAALARVTRGIQDGATGALLGSLHLVGAQARFLRGEFDDAVIAADDGLAFGADRYETLGVKVQALGMLSRYDEVKRVVDDIADTLVEGEMPPARVAVLLHAANVLASAGDHERCDRILAEVRGTRVPLPPRERARLLELEARLASQRGDTAEGLAGFSAALLELESLGDLRWCEAAVNYGSALGEVGAIDAAISMLQRALSACERFAVHYVTPAALGNLTLLFAWKGNLHEARLAGQRTLDFVRTQGDRRVEGIVLHYLALAEFKAGDLSKAESRAIEALDKLRDVTPMLPPVLAGLAQLRLARGDMGKALELARQAFGMLEHLLGVEEGETFVRSVLADVLDRLDRRDEAKEILEQTARRLLARAEKLKDPSMRAAFLWQHPDNARVLASAKAHGCQIPPAEAVAQAG